VTLTFATFASTFATAAISGGGGIGGGGGTSKVGVVLGSGRVGGAVITCSAGATAVVSSWCKVITCSAGATAVVSSCGGGTSKVTPVYR